MTAQNLIEILEATAHNLGLDLDEFNVTVRDEDWNLWDITGYHVNLDERSIVLGCND